MNSAKTQTGSLKKGLAIGAAFLMACAGLNLSGCDDSGSAADPGDPNAEIVIQNPTGGETFTVGQTVHIKWATQGQGATEVNAVNIEVTPDSGKSWATLLQKSVSVDDAQWGDFPWTIPDSVTRLGKSYALAGNNGLRIKISQYSTADTNKIVAMKKPFSVKAK
jgi:hypothetical protein